MKTQVLSSVFTALSASLCCITPVLAVALGTSGIATTFNWIEPLRPYFISASILFLGFAWVQAFTAKSEDECGCEKKTSFFNSKKFLASVTFLSLLFITFPSYSKFFFRTQGVILVQDQDNKKKIELAVKGMTCSSCELHIENEVKKLPGVSYVRASYENGSTVIEFDGQKVDKGKIIAAINETGYRVDDLSSSALLQGKEKNCKVNTCEMSTGDLPFEVNKDLIVLKDVNQIQKVFNQQPEKTKFVAILSSTCKWCLQGAGSIQRGVIENMATKNLKVIIVWSNMLKSDKENTAFRAASLFKNKDIVQFFDSENRFSDVAAKAINPKGEQAWDIYMFFDKDVKWNENMPRPFEYAHQFDTARTGLDQTKCFCGSKLTERLQYITSSL